jgi:hypothetical protein
VREEEKTVSSRHFLIALATALSCHFASAQQPSAVHIQLEDPELYYAFFRAHTNADLKLQAATPAAATQLSASTAALYHITADDLPNLTAQVRQFNVKLGAWFLDEQNWIYQQRAAGKQLDGKTLANYQWQRQRLVMNAQAGVRGALKRSNWAGLYGYINGDFATAVHSGKAGVQ